MTRSIKVVLAITAILLVTSALCVAAVYAFRVVHERSQISRILIDDGRLADSILQLDRASSQPLALEMAESCNQAISAREKLIDELNKLPEGRHSNLVQSLVVFFREENAFVTNKRNLYRSYKNFSEQMDVLHRYNTSSPSQRAGDHVMDGIYALADLQLRADALEAAAGVYDASYVKLSRLETTIDDLAIESGFRYGRWTRDHAKTNQELGAAMREIAQETKLSIDRSLQQ